MGFDVTYHPMDKQQMEDWFFARLDEVRSGDEFGAGFVAGSYGISMEAAEGWREVLRQAVSWTDPKQSFESSYGFALAACQTFFGKYWYTRGSSLTFMADASPRLGIFLSPLPASEISGFPPNPSDPRITENWRSGAWMTPEGVDGLIGLIAADPEARADFEKSFPDGQDKVVLDALKSARSAGLGILEADGVYEPNLFSPEGALFRGNSETLDKAGVDIFAAVVAKQLKEAGIS